MIFTVDTDARVLTINYVGQFTRGELLSAQLFFTRRGVPYRLPSGIGIGINFKEWAAPGGTLLVSAGSITRPNADRSPYTCTIDFNTDELLALFTENVQSLDCSVEVQWETAASSGEYIKSARKKVIVYADTYRDGDAAPSVTPIAGLSFVTTQAEGNLSDEHVLTGSSTITVTVATGLATLSIPSNVNLPGAPTAATAAPGTNTTQLATTAFVIAQASSGAITVNSTTVSGAAANSLLYSDGTLLQRLAIGSALQVLRVNAGGTALEYAAPASGGVTSVAMTVPAILSVSGSPITSSGTLAVTLATQTANTVLAGPTTGADAAPTFRALVAGDIPTLNQNTSGTAAGLSSTLASTSGGSGVSNAGNLTWGSGGSLGTAAYTAATAYDAAGAAAAITFGTLGATTVGAAIVTLTNPGAITFLRANADNTASLLSASDFRTAIGAGTGSGTVTSVAQTFTGGIVSVSGSPVTGSGTLALTVAGTSGGIVYFSDSTTWASSAALAANAIVIGGGAGAAPATTTTGTGVVTAIGNAVNAASGLVALNGSSQLPAVDGSLLTGISAGLTATQTTYLHLAITHAVWS